MRFLAKSNVLRCQMTFLGTHVDREWERIDDVLPVTSILENEPHPKLRELLQQFFYGTNCPYVNIPVFLNGTGDLESLSHLLAQQVGDEKGVVLLGGSGSGKTIAARKAFFDCLHPNDETCPLKGLIPVWLPLNTNETPLQLPPSKCTLRMGSQSLLVELLLKAAGTVGSHSIWNEVSSLDPKPDNEIAAAIWRRLEAWMSGPPLLLFIDFDQGSHEVQSRLVKALPEFFREWGHHGHRAVICCRSTGAEGGLISKLTTSKFFATARMGELTLKQASAYLDRFWDFHEWAWQQEGCRSHVRAPQTEDEKRDARSRLATLNEAVADSSDYGLALPLVMHLVTESRGEPSSEVGRLTGLFDMVIGNYIKRDWKPGLSHPDFRDKLTQSRTARIALTRLATFILERHGQSLSRNLAEQILRNASKELGNSLLDRLNAAGRNSSQYFDKAYCTRRRVINEVLSYGLFRSQIDTVDGRVRLLHDSFLAFFVGFALRQYKGPVLKEDGSPDLMELPTLDDEWMATVAGTMASDPLKWRGPATFLGGTLQEPEVRRLIRSLLGRDSLLPGLAELIQALLSDCPARTSLKIWSTALKDCRLHEEPRTLHAVAHEVERDFQQKLLNLPLLWRAAAPDAEESAQAVQFFSTPIDSLFYAGESGQYVVAVSAGDCKSWHPETGAVQLLGQEVLAAVAAPDGTIVLGCANGAVVRVDMRRSRWAWATPSKSEPLYRVTAPVASLACDANGRIASGHQDGSVFVVGLPSENSEVWLDRKHCGAVRFLHWADSLVSAGVDGRVLHRLPRFAREGRSEVEVAGDRNAPILALDVIDGLAFTAHADRTIRSWERGAAQAKKIVAHTQTVTYLLAHSRTSLSFADLDSRVFYATEKAPHWKVNELKRRQGPILGMGIQRNQLCRVTAERYFEDWCDTGDSVSVGSLCWKKNDDTKVYGNALGAAVIVKTADANVAAKKVFAVGGTPDALVSCSGKIVQVEHASEGGPRQPSLVRGFLHPISCFLIDEQGQAIGTDGGQICSWKKGETPTSCQKVGRGRISALARGRGKNALLVGDETGLLLEFNEERYEGGEPLDRLPGEVTCLASEGELAWAGCITKAIYVYQGRTARTLVACEDGALHLWALGGGRALASLKSGLCLELEGDCRLKRWELAGRPSAMVLDSNKKWFAAGFENGPLSLGRLAEKGCISFPGSKQKTHLSTAFLAAHPSADLLAAATRDRIVRVWKINLAGPVAAEIVVAYPTPGLVTALAWLSEDTLAVAQGDRVLRLKTNILQVSSI